MLKRKIEIGVIPAAGMGLRVGYVSKVLPKCLFPIHNKPVIYYVIQNMTKVGVNKIYVIVHYQKQMIMNYCRELALELKIKIEFIFQEQLNGIAAAIMLVKRHIRQPFMVILGDDVTLTTSLKNLLDIFYKRDAIVAEGLVYEKRIDILRKTCCVKLGKNGRILKIQEKPQRPFSRLRGIGIYIFNKAIFDYIQRTPISAIRNEKEITETIHLVAQDAKAYAQIINGVNINVNEYNDFLETQLIMGSKANKALLNYLDLPLFRKGSY